jgi:MFS family permease
MSSHERSVLAATCLSSLGSFYTMAVTSFALPQIQRGLSIPEDEVASLFALLRFGTLFSLVLAVSADRVGRRRLLIVSVAGCALCNLATAFAQSGLALAWLQLGARLFMGGQILLAGVVVSEELSAENRGWGLGLLAAVSGLGGALTLLVYAFVDSLPYGWRSLFAVGSFGLLYVPWLWRSLQETRRFSDHRGQEAGPSPGRAPWQPLRDIFRLHGWRLAALVGVVGPVTVILEPGSVFVSKHLQDDLGYSPAEVVPASVSRRRSLLQRHRDGRSGGWPRPSLLEHRRPHGVAHGPRDGALSHRPALDGSRRARSGRHRGCLSGALDPEPALRCDGQSRPVHHLDPAADPDLAPHPAFHPRNRAP